MRNLARSFYHKLPIIRELQHIKKELREHNRRGATELNAHLDSYASSLLQQERYQNPKNLNRYERQVFSQGGEDGIVTEIYRRIGCESKVLVEIGCANGLENCTTFLLYQNQGWSGYWIDGDEALIRKALHTFRKPIAEGRLKARQAFVTAENIASILQEWGVPDEIDLFSLDIDRNTYYIWDALPHLHPRVAVIEYNSTIPPSVDWKVAYHADRVMNGTTYFGASLKAVELLGRKLGYSLVGCSLNGKNAFFVRDDLCEDKFEKPFTSEQHFQPPRWFLDHRLVFPPCFSDDD